MKLLVTSLLFLLATSIASAHSAMDTKAECSQPILNVSHHCNEQAK